MSNTFANTSLVTKYSMKALMNNLQFAMKIDRQLDKDGSFAQKVGDSIKIRRPVYATSSSTQQIVSGDVEDIEQGTRTLQLQFWRKVVKEVTSKELTLNITDAYRDIIMPAMHELAQQVESVIASYYYRFYNFTGTPGTTPSSYLDVANNAAALSRLGVPMEKPWCAFYEPDAIVRS